MNWVYVIAGAFFTVNPIYQFHQTAFFFVNLVDAIMSRKGYCSPASAYTAHGPVIRRYKGSLLLPVVLFINMCYKSRQNPLHVRVVHIRAGTLTDLVVEAGQKADQTSNRRTLVQNWSISHCLRGRLITWRLLRFLVVVRRNHRNVVPFGGLKFHETRLAS